MGNIAITKMAGVFPGADNIEAYWQNILHARVAPVKTFEKEYYQPGENFCDSQLNRQWHSLNRIFGLSDNFSRFADNGIDRQIILAQKIVGQCLDNLKMPKEKIGLVIGTEWTNPNYFKQDIEYLYKASGNSALLSRISMQPVKEQVDTIADSLQIGGPCLAVDAACASSLYAMDTGICLLQSGQAEAVIVLGLNAHILSFVFTAFEKLKAFSKEGTILPFSSKASGLILGECVSAVVVEPLEPALLAGRPILAVIKSLGCSTQGAERSAFAPGPQGQLLAYQRAYEKLSPGEIDYVEAHGTATVVGDQTEIAVLDKVFGPYFNQDRKLPIGSVKALIGHTLAAAGMASVIKALLMLREKIIPPHVPVDANQLFAETCLCIPEKAMPWPRRDRLARIGVSAFGFGGSNAHIVLEAFEQKEKVFSKKNVQLQAGQARHTIARQFSPLAIVDFEVAFGAAVNTFQWHEIMKAGESVLRPFPGERFAVAGKNYPDLRKPIQGSFFSDRCMMDISGLRMGPTALSRVDPFQLLVIQIVRALLERNSAVKESNDSGVVFCNNMGGAMPLRLTRTEYLLKEKKCEDYEFTLEELASCLPNMCSGYPVRHFNLKAFHQTVSGKSGIFWTNLINAQVWLKGFCRNLLLGAGHLVKSPVDLLSLQKGTTNCPTIGEGVAVFLIKTLEQAVASGDKILAVIQNIVPAALADTFEGACQLAGIELSAIDTREICQLRPDYIAKGQENDKYAQHLTGFMGEATGVEALSKVLLADGHLGAIEVQAGDKLLMTVFLEKRNKWNNTYEAPRIPMEIVFQHSIPGTDIAAVDADERAVTPNTLLRSLIGWQHSSAAIINSYMAAQRAMISLLHARQCEGILPGDASAPLNWGTQETTHGFIDLDRTLVNLKRSPSNIVINMVRYDCAKKVYTGQLKVDENHSYFFDHPLDHVPGILMLEGICQFVELAALENANQFPEQNFYIQDLDITFKRFCEKDTPITIEIHPQGTAGNCCYQAFVLQNKIVRCNANVKVAYIRPEAFAKKETGLYAEKVPGKEILHKIKRENILISDLALEGPGRYSCKIIELPPEHFFREGNEKSLSVLYLLEVARQFFMQIAHTVKGIPLGIPMILLSVRVVLTRPAQRFVPITLSWEDQPLNMADSILLTSMKAVLRDPAGYIGEVSTLVQVMDEKVYAKQRKLR